MDAIAQPVNSLTYHSRAVGRDAHLLAQNMAKARTCYVGHSVWAQEVYRQQLQSVFDALSNQWKQDTMFSSNSDEIASNPSYVHIIELGQQVVPLILKDLEATNSLWFAALKMLTNSNPVPAKHAGNINAMKNDWLRWAREQNVI